MLVQRSCEAVTRWTSSQAYPWFYLEKVRPSKNMHTLVRLNKVLLGTAMPKRISFSVVLSFADVMPQIRINCSAGCKGLIPHWVDTKAVVTLLCEEASV